MALTCSICQSLDQVPPEAAALVLLFLHAPLQGAQQKGGSGALALKSKNFSHTARYPFIYPEW